MLLIINAALPWTYDHHSSYGDSTYWCRGFSLVSLRHDVLCDGSPADPMAHEPSDGFQWVSCAKDRRLFAALPAHVQGTHAAGRASDERLLTLTHVLLKEHAVAPSAQERSTSSSLEARLKAGEDWRVQQEARTQLEDKWKAGQEAAINQWRSENGARVRVEEDWKALHESRMVNVRCQCLAPSVPGVPSRSKAFSRIRSPYH